MSDLRTDNVAIAMVEKNYLCHKRSNLYVVFEDLDIDYFWDMAEVYEFERMYEAGKTVPEIAEWFGRTDEEVGLLIIDRALKNKIRGGRDERSAV